MKGYIVGHIDVNDAEAYQAYQARVPALIQAHGGRYLVRGGVSETLEGALPGARTVVLEFPTPKAAKQFYDSDEYRAILPIRQSNSDGVIALIEGFNS